MDESEVQAQRERAAQIASERLLQKLRMEKQDEISVTNPLNEGYVIKNFGDDLRERWVFPARAEDIGYGSGKKVVPRYVANTFVERVYGLLVANFNEDFLGKEKKNWKGNILDWPEHQRYIEKRTDSEEMQKKFFPLFEWKLVRKYGMDEMPAGLAAEPDREQKKLTPFEVMMAEAEKENPKLETFAEQVGA